MRVLWVNEAADFIGGCEQYIFNTVRLLREHDVHSSLLYDCRQNLSVDFVKPFDHAFPMVDIKTQVAEIKPDLIYVHRLSGRKIVEELRQTGVPTVRFFHDTKLFCPREHRYTTIGLHTCHKPMGMRCYVPCLGVINRRNNRLGVGITPVRMLRAEIDANGKLEAFVVASEYMASLISEHGLSRNRIHVIPLYSIPPPGTPSVSREPNLFLFAGQLVRSKGLDILLRALASTLHTSALYIVGRGRQEHMFRELARTLELDGRVTFLGQVSGEELSRLYDRATCLVLPARQPESFGLVGPEAMSHGTPVIATNIGGAVSWLENGKTGIAVPPNNVQALAKAMDRIADDLSLRKMMGENARRSYQERFMPERHIQALMGLFGSLAAKGV